MIWNIYGAWLTDVVNASLRLGVVPSCFKTAILTPILKSRSLERDILMSYHPVSNLLFLSKVLETAIANH